MELTFALLWSFLTIALNIIIGLLFITNSKLHKVEKYILSSVYFFLGAWGITQVINYFPVSESFNIFPVRSGYTFVGYAILLIYVYIRQLEKKLTLRNYQVIFALFIFITIVTITPLMVPSIVIEDDMVQANTNIFAASIFVIYTTIILLSSINRMIRIYRTSDNASLRMSMYLFSISLILTVFFGIMFSFFIPNFIEMPLKDSPLIGFGGTFIFSFTSSYIFSRTRFLSVKSYINQISYYIGLVILPFLTFHTVYIIQVNAWGSIYTPNALLTGFIFSAVFIYLILYLQNRVDNLINPRVSSFIQNKSKRRDVFSKNMLEKYEYSEIFELLKSSVHEYLPSVEFLFVVSTSQTDLIFQTQEIPDINYDEIIQKLKGNDKLDTGLIVSEGLRYSNDNEAILRFLMDRHIEVVYRLFDAQGTKGYLVFKRKGNNQPYTIKEIDFFESFIPILVLSITKINLYKEQEHFNQTLQLKVQQATADLKEKNKQLEFTLRKERDMLDILGHELRTPLTIGKNAMKVMKQKHAQGTLGGAILAKYLDIADENLSRESKLLETLLSTTKIDNQALDLHLEKVDLLDVIGDSLRGMRPKAAEKKLEIKYVPIAKADVFADRNRMQEVVDNLIDNAVKYTDEGHVEIIIDDSASEFIKLSVKDTGRGIPKDQLDKLGQKFYRVNTYLDSSKDSDYKVVRPGGTGLGLYVTFSLIRAMGGQVQVTSEIDKGSVFSITIPKFTGQAETGVKDKKDSVFEKFEKMKKEREDKAS